MCSERISRRAALLALTACAVPGCGFVPVYGTAGGTARKGAYQIVTDDTLTGYQIGRDLSARLGTADSPRATLTVTARTQERAAAIDADGDTTRFNILGSAEWRLNDAASGALLGSGMVEAFTSYAATASTIATQTSRDDAAARLSRILADMIVARVLLVETTADAPA